MHSIHSILGSLATKNVLLLDDKRDFDEKICRRRCVVLSFFAFVCKCLNVRNETDDVSDSKLIIFCCGKVKI